MKRRLQNNWNMYYLNKNIMVFVLLMVCAPVFSQTAHKFKLNGDKSYGKQDYQSAEINYRKALEKANDPKSNYNLGNSLVNQKRYQEAAEVFEKSLNTVKDPDMKSKIFHNLGNTWFNVGNFEESIKSYKESLRLNPSDKETRKNLALAKERLREKTKKQENKSNKKPEQKNDKSENNPDNEKQQVQSQQDRQNSERLDKNRISKNEMEKLLKNIEADENEIHKKVIKGKTKSEKRKKNW